MTQVVQPPSPHRINNLRSGIGHALPRHDRTSGDDGGVVPYDVLVKLLNSAEHALDGDDKEARQFIVATAGLIDAEVRRRAAGEHHDAAPSSNRRLAPWQTRRVVEFVEANLADTIRLEDLANLARLSARQFSRAFRNDLGETPYAFVLRRRIEHAKEMMLLTEEPLASIAVRCGLSDQPHLTRMFHRLVGESPASWRRRRRSPACPMAA
jgi:AraC family transcriptional regulator